MVCPMCTPQCAILPCLPSADVPAPVRGWQQFGIPSSLRCIFHTTRVNDGRQGAGCVITCRHLAPHLPVSEKAGSASSRPATSPFSQRCRPAKQNTRQLRLVFNSPRRKVETNAHASASLQGWGAQDSLATRHRSQRALHLPVRRYIAS